MQRGETCGYASDTRLKEKTGVDLYCISAELPCWNRYLLPKKEGRGKQSRISSFTLPVNNL